MELVNRFDAGLTWKQRNTRRRGGFERRVEGLLTVWPTILIGHMLFHPQIQKLTFFFFLQSFLFNV
jgi:hypothetical protein